MFHANNCEVIRDDTSFSLSADQREIFAGWKRPVEIMPEVQDGNPELPLATFMSADGECDLAQDLATDCSVVASLAAATMGTVGWPVGDHEVRYVYLLGQ